MLDANWKPNYWKSVAKYYRELFQKASEDCADFEDALLKATGEHKPTVTIVQNAPLQPGVEQHMYQMFAADELSE